jgi:hypothetical protein
VVPGSEEREALLAQETSRAELAEDAVAEELRERAERAGRKEVEAALAGEDAVGDDGVEMRVLCRASRYVSPSLSRSRSLL